MSSPGYTYGYIALLVVYTLVYFVTTALFFYKRTSEPIRSREWRPVMGSALYGWAFFVIMCVTDFLTTNAGVNPSFYNTSCNLIIWPSVMATPLIVFPHFARAFMLYYHYRLASVRAHGVTDMDATWLYRYRWFLKRYVWGGLLTVILVLSVVFTGAMLNGAHIQSDDLVLGQGCYGNFAYLIVSQTVLAIVLMAGLIAVLFKTRDQYYFKDELKGIIAVAIPTIVLWVVGFQGVYGPNVNLDVFIYILIFGFLVVTMWVPLLLTQRAEFHRPSSVTDEESGGRTEDKTSSIDLETVAERIPLSTVNSSTLMEAVFRDADLLAAFKTYCISSFCVENVNFMVDVRKYSVISDQASMRQEALRMQELYFLQNSPFELNLDDSIIHAVNDCIKNGDFSTQLFETAERRISYLLISDSFYRWRTTNSFAKALKSSALADAIDIDVQSKENLSHQQRKALRKLYHTKSDEAPSTSSNNTDDKTAGKIGSRTATSDSAASTTLTTLNDQAAISTITTTTTTEPSVTPSS